MAFYIHDVIITSEIYDSV